MPTPNDIKFENIDVDYYARKYTKQILVENVIDLSVAVRDYRVFAPRNLLKNYLTKGIAAKRFIKLFNRADYLKFFGIGIDDVDWADYARRLGLVLQDFEALQHFFFFPNQTFIRFRVSGTLYYDLATQDFQLTVPFTPILNKMKVANIVNDNATFVAKLFTLADITRNPSSDISVRLTL